MNGHMDRRAFMKTLGCAGALIASLKKEPLLKAILCGHEHFTFEDRFSPTAVQYMVGANFLFAGREILFY